MSGILEVGAAAIEPDGRGSVAVDTTPLLYGCLELMTLIRPIAEESDVDPIDVIVQLRSRMRALESVAPPPA